MRQVGYLYLFFILFSNTVYPKTPQDKITSYPILSLPISSENLMINADRLYHEQKFYEAIKVYEKIQEAEEIDEINVLKKMALSHAALNDAEKSVDYLEKYLMKDLNTSFMEHEGFYTIKNTLQFKIVIDKYVPKVSVWSFFSVYTRKNLKKGVLMPY